MQSSRARSTSSPFSPSTLRIQQVQRRPAVNARVSRTCLKGPRAVVLCLQKKKAPLTCMYKNKFIENNSSPAEKVDGGEALQIYMLQPKHPPQIHTVWRQTTIQVPCTTERIPEQERMETNKFQKKSFKIRLGWCANMNFMSNCIREPIGNQCKYIHNCDKVQKCIASDKEITTARKLTKIHSQLCDKLKKCKSSDKELMTTNLNR